MKNKSSFSIFKNSSGFSLVETLAALAIFTIIMLGSFDSFLKAEKNLKSQDLLFARQRLFQNLVQIMGNPASIRAANIKMGNTTTLHKCLHGMVCIPFGTTLPPQGISLYLPPMFFDGTKMQMSGVISGPPGQPVQYSLEGEPCVNNPAGTACAPDDYPIAVTTTYEVVCPPHYDIMVSYNTAEPGPNTNADITPSPYCMVAQYLKIRYNFYPTPGAKPNLSFPAQNGVVWVSAVMVARSQ